MSNTKHFQLIKSAHMSEKTMLAAEKNNQIVFKVRPEATKQQIKLAVEKLYDVAVVAVNTVKAKGKVKSFKQIKGKRADFKKAYVTLADGDDINFFDQASAE